MVKGIYQASRSLDVRDKNMSVIANNLANIDTSGYKRKVPFSEILQNKKNAEMKQVTDFRQGEIMETEKDFDLALKGDVFFAIDTDDGLRYTRNGRFTMSDEGILVDENGKSVMGRSGEINIKAAMLNEDQTVTINKKGEILVGDEIIDTVMVVKFEEPQKLYDVGDSQFMMKEENYEIAQDEDFELFQGYLETSNVNPIIEMESMISLNTDFTSSQKIITFMDKSLEQANSIGRV